MDSTSPFSPSSTAFDSSTSSHHAFDEDMAMDKPVQDFSDLFDFENYDSSASSSHTHSPNTVSPNHTPSPLPSTGVSPFAFDPTYDFDGYDFNPADFTTLEKAPVAAPAPEPVVVKQEPLEFGFALPAPAPALPLNATTSFDTTQLPLDQQQALQELLANMIKYQSQYGMELPGVTSPAANPASPATIQPAMLFGSSATTAPAQPPAATAPVDQPDAVSGPTPVLPAQPAVPAPQAVAPAEEHDDEPINMVEEHEQGPSRTDRQGSAVSSQYDDLESRIGALVPLPTIFSAGRGKGGKKGGGMSSVVRGDDEEVDDDDSWRPSPEEYKKLSSKEKRQLRNKLSARAFRNRRKDYIGTLESHIKDRDIVIDAIKAELVNSRSENQDLRRELAALKANTMAALHPETAQVKDEGHQSILAALTGTSSSSSQPVRKSVTPQYNPNKDIPSASFGMWGAKGPFGNGGGTICHTTLVDDIVISDNMKPVKSSTPLRNLPDLPRMNMNPHLNEEAPRMPSLSSTANSKDLSTSFSDWSETNAFTLRSMDSYRVQMWSRLAREAASDKAHIAQDVRPKFFVEAAYAQAAQAHISSKLASSVWSAFAGSTGGKIDSDKLAAVVTGKAKLKVVDAQEKDEADLLAAALGGLKLQSGMSRADRTGLGARENPLGAIGSFFRCSGGVCARAA